MESQTGLDGTSLSVAGYRCMVPAMSGLLRSARPGLVALLAVALVFGFNGLEGAIHSVHHLPAAVERYDHDGLGHEHDGHGHDGAGHGAPAGPPDETCPVAAAALHLTATAAEAPPVLDALSPVALLVTLGTPDGPRIVWREPAHSRAPPSLRSLPS